MDAPTALSNGSLLEGPELVLGRTTAPLDRDPLEAGPSRGRARRWSYSAAGDAATSVGCAVVDLGKVGTAFVWARVGERMLTWERRAWLGRGLAVGRTPVQGAAYDRGGDRVTIAGDGSIELDVGIEQGLRLTARTEVREGSLPVTLATATPRGGWNVTAKAAGDAVIGEVRAAGQAVRIDGGGWRDWTAGRQDRRTRWQWAAGAGRSRDGRRVGLNVSTGMNRAGEGEDLVWWDGVPVPLTVTHLGPVGRPEGDWVVEGPGWSLRFVPDGVRAADENLLLVRSRYVQPVGRFEGDLPDPAGIITGVDALCGVTEDHEALW